MHVDTAENERRNEPMDELKKGAHVQLYILRAESLVLGRECAACQHIRKLQPMRLCGSS